MILPQDEMTLRAEIKMAGAKRALLPSSITHIEGRMVGREAVAE